MLKIAFTDFSSSDLSFIEERPYNNTINEIRLLLNITDISRTAQAL